MVDLYLERLIREAEESLRFADSLGLETHDPFDTKAAAAVAWTYAADSPLHRVARKVFQGLEYASPLGFRRLFKVSKHVTAGGTGRLAQAHFAHYRLTSDTESLAQGQACLKWLLDNPGTSESGLGWGVPFDWSAYFGHVPANTAVSHTTQACGHAFLDFHDLTGQPWALEAAERCAQFLTQDLPQTEVGAGGVSLGYTPGDTSQVVNISAETAAFLLRCGRPADQPLVWKLAQFVVGAQGEHGDFPYSTDGNDAVDHYHTGMVLNALLALSARPDCRAALERGLEFHLANHFLPDGTPRLRPDATDPVDAYSAGESLVVLSAIGRSRLGTQEVTDTVRRLCSIVLDHMRFHDGGFAYRMYGTRRLRIDSLRWAQALICHGLFEAALLLDSEA